MLILDKLTNVKNGLLRTIFHFHKTHLPKGIKVVINLGDMSDDDAFEEY